jgi:predicted ATP-dependent serine protease
MRTRCRVVHGQMPAVRIVQQHGGGVIHDEPGEENSGSRTDGSVCSALDRRCLSDAEDRINLPIEEFARVLGGGIVPGSIVLVGGDPGIGKSTLMLQMAMEMARSSACCMSPVRNRNDRSRCARCG